MNEIEIMRLRMIALADEKGFTDEETVTVSKILDNMMNEYDMKQKTEELI